MANTRQIEPTEIWSPTGNIEATYLGLIDFFNYHFDNGGGTATYSLIGMQTNADGVESAIDIFVGNIQIPSEIVQQWGASDQIMFEYVATTLGLTLVPIL